MTTVPPERPTMNGKPVFEIDAKSIINMESGFAKKRLCDGPTFNTGDACVFSCSFCYVPDMVRKRRLLEGTGLKHADAVIRRKDTERITRKQLTLPDGTTPRFGDPSDKRVIYSSTTVDVAGNMVLVRETIAVCKIILELTNWQIRLLSKSPLLVKVAEALKDHSSRIIYGFSTGTLDDRLSQAFEQGTPHVSKRIAALHWLQDDGYRTFGMICPSLPLIQYDGFAEAMAAALRPQYLEHVWAEVINVRGDSMTKTVKCLHEAGYEGTAEELHRVSQNQEAWEKHARATFLAHAPHYAASAGQLRFLQYTTNATRPWWEARQEQGAVIL